MPTDSELYKPIFVGKKLHPERNLPFEGDDTGDNISSKNSSYNELTALYWGWKNLKNIDALGIVHYRRYLSLNKKKDLDKILNQKQTSDLLANFDIILPKKRHYYIESNYSHYIHAHHQKPIDDTREIIAKKFPDYLDSFDEVMGRKSAHMFNMFIMKKKPLDEYCSWVFGILTEVENVTNTSDFNQYEKRVYGFISERLLDVWLNKHDEYRTTEVNYVFMENQNWFKKGTLFLIRKFFPKKQ